MRRKRRDFFVKDIIWLLIVSILVSAVFAAGFAMTTDKYFAKAITGVMGNFGQYDLLFQVNEEFKDALAEHLELVIKEHFPEATLKPGISLVGKASFFLTLPPKYKNKATFNKLRQYFDNLPGNSGLSIMTEPRINVNNIPGGVFNFIADQVERLAGVAFIYRDNGNLGVVLKDIGQGEALLEEIKAILAQYQVLEVRLADSYPAEELGRLGQELADKLLQVKGIDYARDITLAGHNNEYQYMVNTLGEVKKFLLAYATQVKIIPQGEVVIEPGELLAANGKNEKPIAQGTVLQGDGVVIKVIEATPLEIRGIIIRGDISYLQDDLVYKLLPGDKVGAALGKMEVVDRKGQVVTAVNQGISLIERLDLALADFDQTNGGVALTISGFQNAFQNLVEIRKALTTFQMTTDALAGKAPEESLTKIIRLINSVADDLDYLAKTFARVQVLEKKFDEALSKLYSTQLLIGQPFLASGKFGGVGEKLSQLNSQLLTIEEGLRDRVRQVDDLLNRFNPLVVTLLGWRDKAQSFTAEISSFSAVLTPGSAQYEEMKALIDSTDNLIAGITSFNLPEITEKLEGITQRFFDGEELQLSLLVEELQRLAGALPQLLDEEIGQSLNLIEKYIGGETAVNERVQIFTKAPVDEVLVKAAVREIIPVDSKATLISLPAGTVLPDIRGELFKILAEVRSIIAALIVVVLWLFAFILDHSLIISMLKSVEATILPRKIRQKLPPKLKGIINILLRIIGPANFYAAVIGGVWLLTAFVLAGARVPYVNYGGIFAIGSGLGLLIALLSERINPVDKAEIQAGLSLGIPFKGIMREIVIPAGRPGLMQFLNRWRMIMK